MSVDPAIVEWLKVGAYYATAADAAVAGRWGSFATTSSIDTCLVSKSAAEAEGARQIATLGGPLVVDTHVVSGNRMDLRLRCITLEIRKLGYDAGVRAFVIGADNSKGDVTTLTVVRRL